MTAALILHRGARPATLDDIMGVPTPPPTPTWFPVPHAAVLATVEETLSGTAFAIRNRHLALSANRQQFFATLDLEAPVADGVSLTVGIRNSIDKTLPLGFLAGHRTVVCDNLAFSAELMVQRKHTKSGATRFQEAISLAVGRLDAFQKTESNRIERLMELEVQEYEAEHLILQGWESRVINHIQLPRVLQEWRHPAHPEFEPRTRWSLFNAFTEVLKPLSTSNPQQFAARTFSLNRLLVPPNEGPADIQQAFQQTASELAALAADDARLDETI